LPILLAAALVALAFGYAASAHVRARALVSRLRQQAQPVHELRGVLTALRLGVALIERSAAGAADRLGGLRAQLERAQLAVTELDSFRLGSLERDAPGTRLDLGRLVLERAGAWSQLAPAYGALLEARWEAGSAIVLGRRESLGRAIDNLIANALEHAGGRVSIEGERCGDEVRVVIADRGPGLRRPLAKLNQQSSNVQRGHGLAIALDAIEAHGGRLVARRGLPRSAMLMYLPLADPCGDVEASAPSSGAGRLATGNRGRAGGAKVRAA